MRSQAHRPIAEWGRKAPQQRLSSTPIPCSEWGQLDQGAQELFWVSWGNLCQGSITLTWKGFFWCFSGISCISICDYGLLSCHWVLMGIIWPWQWVFFAWDFWRQISAVKVEVKVALSTSALYASLQQQALLLVALAFAADMVVGAPLVLLHILC